MPFLVAFWKPLAIAILMALLLMQTERLKLSEATHATFIAQIEAQGKIAAAAVQAKIAADKLYKEKLDENNQQHKRDLSDIIKRMRSNNPPASSLPAVPTGSKRPDLACFDRIEYQREDGIAIAKLFTGARSLADEGSACAIDLNTGKEWINAVK